MSEKIAVFFPGIGYHCDKPLLYYSRKLFLELGYKCVTVDYNGFGSGIKGDKAKMKEAFETAYSQTELILSGINWQDYDDIVFISKSIGTVVAASFTQKNKIQCRNIFLTPLKETFMFNPENGIVFHGSSDSWADTGIMKKDCTQFNLTLHIISEADHSLEIKDTHENIKIVEDVIDKMKAFIQ